MNETRPLIGLTGRRKYGSEIIGAPEVLHHLQGDWFYADYAQGVFEAGGIPVNLPLNVPPAMFADHLDGILLTGGTDIDPSRYNRESETDEFPLEPDRDEFELSLLSQATIVGMPVLGICRGLQVINVHAGGTLHQHVPEHAKFNDAPNTLSHEVSIEPGCALSAMYGDTLSVNSLHHQTVDTVGSDLKVTARFENTVEGLEHDSLPIVAVQWHPEMLDTRKGDPIFSWLIDQALAHRESRESA